MTIQEDTTPGEFLSRDLEIADIPSLAAFAPAEWQMALDAVLLQHFGRSYFHARVLIDGGSIAAVGQAIVTGASAWIGNIIVRPDSRNRGLGSRITLEIVNLLRSRGCTSLVLIATQLGEPVYRKLGFLVTGEYVFLRVPQQPVVSDSSLRRLLPSDAGDVRRLDTIATGESRGGLLEPHLGSGWAHTGPDGAVDGFFLPSFGSGFVMACDPAAGLALLRFKHALYPGGTVIPAGNQVALEFLASHGAEETGRAPRMVLGEDVAWRPETIFARASGYCG